MVAPLAAIVTRNLEKLIVTVTTTNFLQPELNAATTSKKNATHAEKTRGLGVKFDSDKKRPDEGLRVLINPGILYRGFILHKSFKKQPQNRSIF